MAGVPAAMQAARKYGMRVIPGIEISAKIVQRGGALSTTTEEPVHILAYYGCCGPSNCGQLERKLAEVRAGRFNRAKEMVRKLKVLQKPIKWENVLRIAGEGVAPGRPHVARALFEAGHVDSVGQAFTKYLYNDGPAYATGAELPAVEVVNLIQQTGGVSVLAHPWALKDPIPLIEQLANVGLHGVEVYRSDGRHPVFGTVAEACNLAKIGGSDFHARGDPEETDLGAIALPAGALHEFLKLADPVWSSAVEHILQDFAEGTLEGIGKDNESCFMEKVEMWKGDICVTNIHLPGEEEEVMCLRLSPWLSKEERQMLDKVASRFGLRSTLLEDEDHTALAVYRQ
ncbi:hypothetical protein Mapa_013936 [Marchantia paleacea]|nr:hypothetical protein Mapa_013936 [Marchantia paleacea]